MRRKPSGLDGAPPSNRLRLSIPLAALAAFFILATASSASAAINAHVKLEGTGSGEVIGSAPKPGNPPIKCHKPAQVGDVCDTEAVAEEGSIAVNLIATAAPGSKFTGWTVVKGSAFPNTCGTKVNCTVFSFNTGSELEAKATFEKLPNVHVLIEGTGSGEVYGDPFLPGVPAVSCSYVSPGPATGTCNVMAQAKLGLEGVKLRYTTAPGSEFVEWKVEKGTALACEPLGEFCTATLEEPSGEVVVKAVFNVAAPPTPEFALTVTKEGGEGTVVSNPAGIECGGTCTDEFEEGSKVTLTASPAAGFKFASWKGCEKGGAIGHTCTVTMDKAKTVVAKFGPVQSLTVGKAGSGTGSVKSSPSGISCDLNCSSNVAAFTEGASVVLTATPTKYHTFTGWSGSGCSGTGTCTVTMSGAKEVTAEFAATKFNLTLSKAGGGTGAVKSKPASLTCGATCSSVVSSFFAGTEVEVTATPSKGSTLNWSVGSGTCTGSTSPCFVTMSAAKSLTAEFK